VKKEITFFYRDECEKWATENIFYEAKKKGYKVKYSKNLQEKCEIGIYPLDEYKKTHSKLSIVMLHGMDQGRIFWPNHWSKEPWNNYDIGFLPGRSWVDRWQKSSWDPGSQTKKGVYETGWPKSDRLFDIEFKDNVKALRKKLKLNYKNTILYAPSFETDNKEIDVCNSLKNLKVNLLIKHWLTKKDYKDNLDLKKNIQKANKYAINNTSNTTIIDPNLSIIDALAISDILITDESSVLYEALLLDIPTLSVSDWLMRTNNSSVPRLIRPSKDCYKAVKLNQLNEEINKILKQKEYIKKKIKYFKNYHYSNLGKSSKIILSIIDRIALNKNFESIHKLKPKYKTKNYIPLLRSTKNVIIKILIFILPLFLIKIFSQFKYLKIKFNKIKKF
jgi:hypothetical protein